MHLYPLYKILNKKTLVLALAVLNSFILFNTSFAQSKAAARYEIDAKRIGVYPTDKDALPRSREFIRLDSTYYVGWMYEGIYKYERSADYLGYKQAIPPLEKALRLLEKDYGKNLKKLYSSFMYFQEFGKYFGDFYEIATRLEQAYNDIEMPDSSMMLLNKIESYQFQRDFFSVYCDKAWVFHRNRFYTSEKYDFLKNSVEENEKMALYYCNKQYKYIQKNRYLNDYWYGSAQSESDELTVDHYMAILHCYNQSYDSCEFYYQRLVNAGRVLWGNYAGMQLEMGNFQKAMEYFSKPQYTREHALSESDYFMPTLLVYAGRTKEAIRMEQQKIKESGSTPGFGWYNIALARSYLYDGQLDSCAFFLEKATNFKELHINTTLTQSQYDFTINLLKVQLLDKKMKQVKFLNKGWWYSLSDLYDVISLKIQKVMQEYIVVTQLANDPERKRIVYDLFCAESTVSYDEIVFLLKDFSSPFFQNKYVDYQRMDKRERVKRYFKLVAAKLKFENDEDAVIEDAESILNEIAGNSTDIDLQAFDPGNEKLFLARLYEILAVANTNKDLAGSYGTKLLEEYPQLVPFSGIDLKIHLTVGGINDKITDEVIASIKSSNIEWVNESEKNNVEAVISFQKKGNVYQATVNVKSETGKTIVADEQLIFKTFEGVGKELALRLFGVGGRKVY